jgi:hypothetical protein
MKTFYQWLVAVSSVDTREAALDILGLPDNATVDQIKTAYIQKSKESHPDLGGSHEQQKDVNAAYEFLYQQATGNYTSSGPTQGGFGGGAFWNAWAAAHGQSTGPAYTKDNWKDYWVDLQGGDGLKLQASAEEFRTYKDTVIYELKDFFMGLEGDKEAALLQKNLKRYLEDLEKYDKLLDTDKVDEIETVAKKLAPVWEALYFYETYIDTDSYEKLKDDLKDY